MTEARINRMKKILELRVETYILAGNVERQPKHIKAAIEKKIKENVALERELTAEELADGYYELVDVGDYYGYTTYERAMQHVESLIQQAMERTEQGEE